MSTDFMLANQTLAFDCWTVVRSTWNLIFTIVYILIGVEPLEQVFYSLVAATNVNFLRTFLTLTSLLWKRIQPQKSTSSFFHRERLSADFDRSENHHLSLHMGDTWIGRTHLSSGWVCSGQIRLRNQCGLRLGADFPLEIFPRNPHMRRITWGRKQVSSTFVLR